MAINLASVLNPLPIMVWTTRVDRQFKFASRCCSEYSAADDVHCGE